MKIAPYTSNDLPPWFEMRALLFGDENPGLLEEGMRRTIDWFVGHRTNAEAQM